MTEETALSQFPSPRHNHRRCIADAMADAEKHCRTHGLRLTPIRRRVLELIWQDHVPIKAYDLLSLLQQEGHKAAPPTVYRALDFLIDAGVVHRLDTLNAFVGCVDPATDHSGQFFICTQCQMVAEIRSTSIGQAIEKEAVKVGFRVRSRPMEIPGLCPRCANH